MSKTATTNKTATANKTATSKGKNAVVTSKQAPKKTEKIIYLSVTGKILNGAKIDTNKAVKEEIRTFSFAKRYSLQFDRGFYSSFVKFNENDLTPANLLPLRTAKEKISSDKNGFSSWLFMSLVKRYYATKK
jgi:hypothetical protein